MTILYLSGDHPEHDRGVPGHWCRGRGFLHKPFTVDALIQKVADILRRRAQDPGPAATG